MWTIQNDKNGVWQGKLTEQEMHGEKFGLWTIGTAVPEGEPGHTDKLWYKTWYADPKKYRKPGHHVLPGAHGGRNEFVKVMDGCLACTTEGRTKELRPGESVELHSLQERTWILPDKYQDARGIAICRFLSEPYWITGGGPTYDLRVVETPHTRNTKPWIQALEPSQDWTWRYIEIFDGTLSLEVDGSEYSLRPAEFIFISAHKTLQFIAPAQLPRFPDSWPDPLLPLRAVVIMY